MARTVMNTQKAENLLNLALDATQVEREKSLNLEVGYDPADREWELIIKYDQSTSTLEEYVQVVPLSFGYGIVRIPESRIGWLAGLPEVEYIEKPKRLFFAVDQGKTASCLLFDWFEDDLNEKRIEKLLGKPVSENLVSENKVFLFENVYIAGEKGSCLCVFDKHSELFMVGCLPEEVEAEKYMEMRTQFIKELNEKYGKYLRINGAYAWLINQNMDQQYIVTIACDDSSQLITVVWSNQYLANSGDSLLSFYNHV